MDRNELKKEWNLASEGQKLFFCKRYGIMLRTCKLYGCKYHASCKNPDRDTRFETEISA